MFGLSVAFKYNFAIYLSPFIFHFLTHILLIQSKNIYYLQEFGEMIMFTKFIAAVCTFILTANLTYSAQHAVCVAL